MNARLQMAHSEREELLDKLRRSEREHTGYILVIFFFLETVLNDRGVPVTVILSKRPISNSTHTLQVAKLQGAITLPLPRNCEFQSNSLLRQGVSRLEPTILSEDVTDIPGADQDCGINYTHTKLNISLCINCNLKLGKQCFTISLDSIINLKA